MPQSEQILIKVADIWAIDRNIRVMARVTYTLMFGEKVGIARWILLKPGWPMRFVRDWRPDAAKDIAGWLQPVT